MTTKALKRPYEHRLSERAWKKFFKELKALCKDERLQFPDPVHRKPVTYGYKISMFVLGYRPGLCGENPCAPYCPGLTRAEWRELSEKIVKFIETYVPDAALRVEPWSNTEKFSIRWKTYIQTREP